ncbi:histidine kinase [Paenibacillus aurantius]|uniref:histidine kinase n=1 Tax=Paenibacillus aurantius TaxID=2918900 RepID=A0AA96LH42_9BACL|nr:histidine kinase [Paenibacillus aurantius]WNQ13822.1 histidine kinase [Paenibacillus aurantius]
MTYKQIKWMILIVPTIVLGLFEYARHNLFMKYISMGLGNWLAPVILLAVLLVLMRILFKLLEGTQEELNKERSVKAALEERERLARELHDGIAQSLFLLSVKMDRLEHEGEEGQGKRYGELRQTVHQVNEYVRQAISNLRFPPQSEAYPWRQSIEQLLTGLEESAGIRTSLDWTLDEEGLTPKEKVELYAFVREALINVQKHAQADSVQVTAAGRKESWVCTVRDDGKGFKAEAPAAPERYGLRILKERAAEMGWKLEIVSSPAGTSLTLEKGGKR